MVSEGLRGIRATGQLRECPLKFWIFPQHLHVQFTSFYHVIRARSLFIYYLNLLSYAYYLPSSSIHSTGYEKETGRKVIIRHQSARLDLCSPGLLDSRNSDLSTEVDAEGIFAIYLIGRVTSRSAALPLASGLPNLRQESPG